MGGALSPCQEKGLPNPGETGGSETLRQMSLVPFFPLKTKQSGCVQWPLRKASHFLRRYQASPGIVSISSNGCYYLSSSTAGLSAVLGEVTRVFFSAFHRAGFSPLVRGKYFLPLGHGTKAELTAQKSSRSGCSWGGSKGARCGLESC